MNTHDLTTRGNLSSWFYQSFLCENLTKQVACDSSAFFTTVLLNQSHFLKWVSSSPRGRSANHWMLQKWQRGKYKRNSEWFLGGEWQPVHASFTLMGNNLVFAVQQIVSCVLLTQNKSCFSGSVFSCLYFFPGCHCFFMLSLFFSFSLLGLNCKTITVLIFIVCLYVLFFFCFFCLACICICTPIGSVRWVEFKKTKTKLHSLYLQSSVPSW